MRTCSIKVPRRLWWAIERDIKKRKRREGKPQTIFDRPKESEVIAYVMTLVWSDLCHRPYVDPKMMDWNA